MKTATCGFSQTANFSRSRSCEIRRINRKDNRFGGRIRRNPRNHCRGAPFDLLSGGRGGQDWSCSMPLGRYFIYIGSVLLALLFAIDWYWPQPASRAARVDVDHTPIRIQSQHRWPNAVVFDTSQPTIVPPAPAPEVVAEAPPARSPRDAMAMVQQPEPVAQPAKPAAAPKRVARRAKVARAPAPRVASSDMFGFRNSLSW
jgi:hypothetical protein